MKAKTKPYRVPKPPRTLDDLTKSELIRLLVSLGYVSPDQGILTRLRGYELSSNLDQLNKKAIAMAEADLSGMKPQERQKHLIESIKASDQAIQAFRVADAYRTRYMQQKQDSNNGRG